MMILTGPGIRWRLTVFSPFPVMGGLWHCFTHINSDENNDEPCEPMDPIKEFLSHWGGLRKN
jgi:hypothetical protein